MTTEYTKDEFVNVYYEYHNEILEYCYMHSPDKKHIQELSDQVFMKAWEQVLGGAHVEDVRAFLYQIADGLIKEKESLYNDIMAFSILSSNRVLRHNPNPA